MNSIHTHTVEEDIAKKLWQKFSKEKISIIKKIPSGFKNRSYYIRSKPGKEFVLKIYAQNYLTKDQIEERGRIVKELENKGVPVLEMVHGLNNKFAQEIKIKKDNYLAVLSKYIEVPFSELQVNEKIVKTVAIELKKLHKELSKIKHSQNFKKLEIITSLNSLLEDSALEKIHEHFNEKGKRSKRLTEFLKFYTNEGNKLLKYFNKRKNMFKDPQLNHGDFNLNNFLVENGSIIKIFDFDELTIAPKSYEVALSIYYLDYPEEFYTDELIQKFIETYYEKEEITKDIVEDIITFMKYRAYYRLARYFIYYQFTDVPGGHFTKFQRHLEKFNRIDPYEIYEIIKN